MTTLKVTQAGLGLVAILAGVCLPAEAGVRFVIARPGGWNAGLNTLADQLEAQVNSQKFSTTQLEGFTGAMSKATALSGSTLVVEGPELPKVFSFGGTLSVGANLPDGVGSLRRGVSGVPSYGVSPQVGVTVGLAVRNFPKLAIPGLDPERLVYYLNGFSISESLKDGITAGMKNFGVRARYLLVAPSWGRAESSPHLTPVKKESPAEPKKGEATEKSPEVPNSTSSSAQEGSATPSDSSQAAQAEPKAAESVAAASVPQKRSSHSSYHWLARWTGLYVGAGLEYSAVDLVISQKMKPISQSGLGVKMSWTPTVSGTVSSSAFSIPLEISTGVTLLSFWDLYLGAGGNLNFGSASLNGSGAGPVTVTGAADSTATLTIDPVSGKPGLVGLHGFLGTQFALWKARLFVQGTLGASSAYGVATGLRFVF